MLLSANSRELNFASINFPNMWKNYRKFSKAFAIFPLFILFYHYLFFFTQIA